jgi:hypothetical protein
LVAHAAAAAGQRSLAFLLEWGDLKVVAIFAAEEAVEPGAARPL